MDDFLRNVGVENADTLAKFMMMADCSEELFVQFPLILVQFLNVLMKKYLVCLPEDEAFCADRCTQTEDVQAGEETNNWTSGNIAKDVALEATKNLAQNGFVYDENTGMYYDHKIQCYYNPEYKLYYYHQTGTYYYYDDESQSLKYYSSATPESNSAEALKKESEHLQQPSVPPNFSSSKENLRSESHQINNVSDDSTSVVKSMENIKMGCVDSEKEEGECSDDDSMEPNSPNPVLLEPTSPSPIIIESGPKAVEPDHAKHIAPCIRALVTSSSLEGLDAGTLFIVTCTGGTLGREGNHDILIPAMSVSKLHSSFHYVYKDGCYFYEIIDMGSRNGTYLNGTRLSDSLARSEPHKVTHGSVITVGGIDLLCHIHPGDESCPQCESYLTDKVADKKHDVPLREKYNMEALAIRKKFGIFKPPPVKLPQGYEDRSLTRRKTVGSSHDSEKTEAASVDVAVDKKNKGFSLLSKMGWVEGTPLGKSETGTLEPIKVERKEGKAGLGCDVPEHSETPWNGSKKLAISKKTSERYQKLLNTNQNN